MANKELFYVYKKTSNNNGSIIGAINNKEKFVKFVELDIKKMDHIKNYLYVDEYTNVENQLGFFLKSENKQKIKLVRQYAAIEKGLCFDSILQKTQIIASWKLLENNYDKILSNEINCATNLNLFDTTQMCKNPNILIIGDNNYINKQYLIRDIIGNSNKYQKNIILDKFDCEQIDNLLKTQITDGCKDKVCVIINCNNTINDLANNKSIKKILLDGKHYNITLIVYTTFPLILSDYDFTFDYIFLCENNNISIKEKIYGHYANFIGSFNDFNKIFTKYTANNNSLVISNKYITSNGIDRLSVYVPNLE